MTIVLSLIALAVSSATIALNIRTERRLRRITRRRDEATAASAGES